MKKQVMIRVLKDLRKRAIDVRQLDMVIAVLESEPEPLVVVEGWMAEEELEQTDGLIQLWQRDALFNTTGHIPVVATVTRRESGT